MSALVEIRAEAVQPHGPDLEPLPESGTVDLLPLLDGPWEGKVRSRPRITTEILDGTMTPVRILPGQWRVTIKPAHGRPLEPFTLVVPGDVDVWDLAWDMPVETGDDVVRLRGLPGRGILDLTKPNAAGVATLRFDDGTSQPVPLQTLTLTPEERAALDAALAAAIATAADVKSAAGAAQSAADAADAAAVSAQISTDAASRADQAREAASQLATQASSSAAAAGTAASTASAAATAAEQAAAKSERAAADAAKAVADARETTSTLTAGAAVAGGTITLCRSGNARTLTIKGVKATGTSEALAALAAGDAGVGIGWALASGTGASQFWPVQVQGTSVQLLGPPEAGLQLSGTVVWSVAGA